MNSDFRVSVDFCNHHKTKMLYRRLGAEGVFALIKLWSYAARERADGDLSGMTAEAVEVSVDWIGEEGLLVKSLIEVGFLDGEDGSFSLHNWAERNPWAAEADARSDAARFSRMARTIPEAHQKLAAAGINSISKSEYEKLKAESETERTLSDRSTNAQRTLNDRSTVVNESSTVAQRPLTSASTPAPAPSPSPTDVKNTSTTDVVLVDADRADPPADEGKRAQRDQVPCQKIVDLYHATFPPAHPRVLSLNEARRRTLRARWRDVGERVTALHLKDPSRPADSTEARLDYIKRVFEAAAKSDFLTGRSYSGNKPFFADFDFLTKPHGWMGVIEGKYRNREVGHGDRDA